MKRSALVVAPLVCSLLLVAGGAAAADPVVKDPLVKVAGTAPTAVVAGANGAFFVLNSGPDSVIQYDAAGQQVGASAALLPSGSASTDMISDAYGSLYVANPGSHSISKVDTKTNAVKPIALPSTDLPIALGISSVRSVYALETNDTITRVDSADKVTLDFAKLPVGSGALDIVTDSGGYSYTANYNTETISQISPTGVVVEYARTDPGFKPTSLTLDRGGRLLVGYGSNVVDAFDLSKPAGTAAAALYLLDPGSRPSAPVVDEFNNMYLANAGTGTISVIPQGEKLPQTIVSGLAKSSMTLAIGSNIKLLIGNKAGDAVSTVDLETRIQTSTLSALTVGAPFTGTATATGVGDITFSSPDLPAWLKLDAATGALTGTPTTAGSSSFTLRAISSTGRGDARTVTFTVAAAPSTPSPTATPTPTSTAGSGTGTGAGSGTGVGTGSGTGAGGSGAGGRGTSSLASTGAADPTPWGVAALLAAAFGAAGLAVAARRRSRAVS